MDMKKVILAMMAFLPMFANAQQESVEDWEYNDSTEYVLTPKMVTDTAAVEKFVNECRAKWRLRIDSLNKDKDLLNAIREYSDKKLPEEYLPVCQKYLEWIKGIYSTNKGRYSNRYRIEIQYVKNPKYCGSLDIEKAEKQLNKGKLYPQMGGLLGAVIAKDIDPLIKKTQDSINYMDMFDTYVRVANHGTVIYPQKQVLAPTKNKNYRPNLFMEYRDRSSLSDVISEFDEKFQSRGWEWIINGKYDNKSESYPISYEYRKYAEHPEYKVLWRNYQPVLFDKDGNLVRVAYMSSRANNDIWDIIHENLLILEYRKDYEANKYNIKSEDSDVQYALRNRLGYSDEASNKMMTALAKTMAQDVASYDANTFKEYVTTRRAAYQSAKGYVNEMPRLANVTAANFWNQLEKDHENEYKYLYKIERLGDNSFKLQFVTYDMKPQYDVYVTYFGVAPFVCDYAIERVKKY